MKVLVVADNNEIFDSVSHALLIEWPKVEIIAANSSQGTLVLLGSDMPDVILLGSHLKRSDATEILEKVRSVTDIPVVILTESSDEHEVLQFLDSGADDFVIVPFTRVELVTRIKQRIHLHHDLHEKVPLEFGTLRYDAVENQFFFNNENLLLTPTEQDILYHLLKNAGRVLRHTELVKLVWGTEQPNPAQTLKVHIHHLRIKFENKEDHVIQTWPNLGYSIGVPE